MMILLILLNLLSLTTSFTPSPYILHTYPNFLQLKYSKDDISLPNTEDEVYIFKKTNQVKNPLNRRRNLPKYERDMKRRKLFLLSTVLEDLLPDPSQGQSKLLNTLMDANKIIKRASFNIFNYIYELPTSVSIFVVLLLFAYSGIPLINHGYKAQLWEIL
jgi:hypothetical protein